MCVCVCACVCVTELMTYYVHGAAVERAGQDVGAVMLSASETLDTE